MAKELELPPRPGDRPRVTKGIPQIQLADTASDELLVALSEWAFSLRGIDEQPSRASLPGARALTVAPHLPANRQAMIVGREFAHIHVPPDGAGSLHLRLPDAQAAEVVNAGWGEWHPFAVNGTMPTTRADRAHVTTSVAGSTGAPCCRRQRPAHPRARSSPAAPDGHHSAH